MNVVALYEYSGDSVHIWAENGFDCHCFDIQHIEPRDMKIKDGFIRLRFADLYKKETYVDIRKLEKPHILFGFPPCTDLSSAGARHWDSKREADRHFQIKAVNKARIIEMLANYWGCRYIIENPVGAMSSLWRPPDYMYNPCDYGGYLPENDVNPFFPKIIPPRDAYTKLTCIWSGNGFVMPPMKPIKPIFLIRKGKKFAPQVVYSGGDSIRTKNIRSATPRGFSKAVYEYNK